MAAGGFFAKTEWKGVSLFDSSDSGSGHRKVLVLGAGELGENVLRAISRRSATDPTPTGITVLLRPATTSDGMRLRSELAAQRIAIEEADIATASVSQLSSIMSRFHTVVSCIGFAAGAGTQRKITEAVLAAGVPRYFPWQFGVDYDAIGRGSPQDLFDEQLDVRELLRGQGDTEWIIISTGMFTSFLFEPSFGVVDLSTNTIHALGDWDTQVTVTTAEDIGSLTAEILGVEPRIANKVVYVAGDTLTFGQLADIVERVKGKAVDRDVWSVPHLLDDLERHPADPMRKYRAVFAQGRGVAWPKAQTFNAVHAIPTTTAEEWARANLG
jgi:hypothetical protein